MGEGIVRDPGIREDEGNYLLGLGYSGHLKARMVCLERGEQIAEGLPLGREEGGSLGRALVSQLLWPSRGRGSQRFQVRRHLPCLVRNLLCQVLGNMLS